MLFFILSLLAHLYHFTLVQKDLFCLDGGLIATAGIQPILEGGLRCLKTKPNGGQACEMFRAFSSSSFDIWSIE